MTEPTVRFYQTVAWAAAGRAVDAAARWLAGHGLASRALREQVDDAGLRDRLERDARAAVAHNLHWIDGFQRIVDALGAIRVCALKGIALLDTAYADDPGGRRLSDLDLLVEEDRLESAVRRLGSELGLVEPESSRRAARWHHERHLRAEPLVVDLHRRLGTTVLERSSWDAVAPVAARLHERDAHLLDRQHTLVHLVTHFAVHGPFTRLAWVEDLVRLPLPDAAGQRALAAMAWRLGAGRALASGVRSLRWLVGPAFLPELPVERRSIGQALWEGVLWRGARTEPLAVRSPRRGALSLGRLLLADSAPGAWRALLRRAGRERG